MSYGVGTTALVALCLSGILWLAALNWLVKHTHTRLTTAWLVGLASLVVLQSLEYLYHANDLHYRWPFFLKLVDPLVILMPFCLYGYIQALSGKNIIARKLDLLKHCFPAIVVALLDVTYWSLPSAEKIEMIALVIYENETLWRSYAPYGNVYLAIIAALSLFYWWYQRRLGYPSRKGKLNQWIDQLQMVQLAVAVLLFIRIFASEVFGWYFSAVFFMAPVSAYLVYLFLSQSQLPQAAKKTIIKSLPDSETEDEGIDDALVKMSLTEPHEPTQTDDVRWQCFERLKVLIEEGAYRENEISLTVLSQRCELTTHQASEAINYCAQCNFYEWINSFRVEAAKQALRDTSEPVGKICYEVGFNSKSTFNTAFRKRVGCTPTQYRKKS
ncbi:helix-turn-helix domain-containing protein [Litoribrevibacter euphylliae]|uniref:Helix-turn-helix domain-containing protein n=1 Tax=Litoribrevibacter euphylliae TaxID=1834034 RepID=A0ABV7HJQ3_9GAMM